MAATVPPSSKRRPPVNEASQAFHRRMGFAEMTLAPDYASSGRTRIVMRRPLPLSAP